MPLASLRTLRTFPKALKFNGNEYVVVSPFNFNEITVEIWFKANIPNQLHSNGLVQNMEDCFESKGGWDIYFSYMSPVLISGSGTTNNGDFYWCEIKNDLWYQLVFTWSSSIQELYKNAVREFYRTPTVGPPTDLTSSFWIGRAKQCWGNKYFIGNVAIVRYYSKILNQSEIQHNYNNPLNPITDGLVLWLDWTSIDIANGLWLDRSGYGNEGTIYGATEETIIKSPVRKLNRVRLLNAVR